MTVEQTDVIDFVSHRDNEIELSIADHLDWLDDEYLLVRQNKLNKYLEFVESGQLWKEFDYPKNSSITIKLHCKYEPSEIGRTFLNRAASAIEEAGFKF